MSRPVNVIYIYSTAPAHQHEQPREDTRPPSPADSIDERIAHLVASDALPPAPPANPTLYDRLYARYLQVSDLRSWLGWLIDRARWAIRWEDVEFVFRVTLPIRFNRYARLETELVWRLNSLYDFLAQNPEILPDDMLDSSDDEIEVFGRDPPPGVDDSYNSNGPLAVRIQIGEGENAPTITIPTDVLEDHLGNTIEYSRGRRVVALRMRRNPRILGHDAQTLQLDDQLGSHEAVGEDLRGGHLEGSEDLSFDTLQSVRERGHAFAERLSTTEGTLDDGEEAGDSGDFGEGIEDEGYENDFGVDEADYEFTPDSQEDGLEMARRPSQYGEAAVPTHPDRPHNWQPFHQYFMYACRGDITAVTGELQATFKFEPEVSRDWVGKQLNKVGNIRKQLEYLECSLPGEIGTIDRAQARQRMQSSDFFVKDIFDGTNLGQIFDIDPTSEAYAEPVRPSDLAALWTPDLDGTLLVALPGIRLMDTFRAEYLGISHERLESGIGTTRKEDAISMRFGQLRYLKLSDKDMAVGRQRAAAQAYADSLSADEPETDEDGAVRL